MILAKLIRGENEFVRFATATPATVATLEGKCGRTVATVATVNVATPTKANYAPSDSRPKRYSYRFRLHGNEGGGLYITDDANLERARGSLLKRYGRRLAVLVREKSVCD